MGYFSDMGGVRRVLFVILVLAGTMEVSAYRVTVNSTKATSLVAPDTNYQTLNEVFTAIRNGVLKPAGTDSVLFTDTAQVTFPMSGDMNISSSGNVVFIGMQVDPDRFPILNHTSSNWYSYFHTVNVTFERVNFTGTVNFNSGQAAKKHLFRNCVIRDFSSAASSFFLLEGATTLNVTFENCLFAKNAFSKGAIDMGIWGGAPVIKIINCTFHNTGTVFYQSNTSHVVSGTSIYNCIFSANTAVFNGSASLLPRITYSLTQDSGSLGSYGTGCVYSSDPRYIVPSGKTKPSEYRPIPASLARNLGTSTDAPPVDISDTLRIQDSTGRCDAGCWDIRDTVVPPSITTHLPRDTSVGIGQPLVLIVEAAGSKPFTYSWRRVGVATPVSTADSMEIPVTAAIDDGAQFICVVKNSRDSAFSDTIRLHVVALPVITGQPATVDVYLGDTATFTVTATGEGIVYSWKRNGESISGADAATYKRPNTIFTDSGFYKCYVTNIAGVDSSDPILLRVLPLEPKITSRTPDTMLSVGASITLHVYAQGTPELSYLWKKAGESATLATTDSLPLTNLTSTNGVVYRCIVSNTAGKDSADIRLIVSSGVIFNPLMFKGEFVNPRQVRVTISSFRLLPFSSSAPPYVDSIGIWNSTLTFPSGALSRSAANCTKISLQQMRAGGVDDSYDTVLQFFDSLPDECKSLYLVASPLWNDPDTILAVGSPDQRAVVMMCSPDTLKNQLVVNVTHQRVSDSIVVAVNNLKSIGRDSLMYLTIKYCFGTDTSRPAVNYKILPADLPATPADLYSKTFHDSGFAGMEDSVTVWVSWRGILGNTSPSIIKKIVTGTARPVNGATLSADSATTGAIYVHWQFSGTPDIDSVRLWWGRQAVPLSANIDTANYDHITLTKGTTAAVIADLLSGTHYSIGLQVSKDDIWSFVTEKARDTCTTKSTVLPTIPNKIKLVSSVFDTATNLINVSWNVDTTGIGPIGNLVTGIVWAVGIAPSAAAVPGDQTGKTVTNLKVKGNAASIDPGEELAFSSTYHIALLLRRTGDAAWATATDSSRGTVSIPAPSWQVVSYFTKDDSIVTAFNHQVKLWKEGNGTVSVTDTLRIFKPDSVPKGFVIVSQFGVNFVKDAKSDPINIGLRYDTTLLKGLIPADIRMYQYSPDSGWRVVDGSTLNASEMIVSVAKRTADYMDPFILMVDILPPIIKIISDTASPILPQRKLVDTIVVSDNVANSTVQLFYWSGSVIEKTGGPLQHCYGVKDTVNVEVPENSINDEYSTHAQAVISDGRFSSTIDISRVVLRQTSDGVYITSGVWTPVAATACLTDNSVESALAGLCTSGKWAYDSIHFRIYRWIDTAAAGAAGPGIDTSSKWVEYNPSKRSLFDMVPGRVIWVKTREDENINLGTGTTVSLKQPYSITLKAKNWTDIALPFKFNIRIGDIIDATGRTSAVADNIQIYKWENGPGSNIVHTVQKYIPNLAGFDSSTITLACRLADDGIGTYSVYNESAQDIDLRIPPIPETLSPFKTYPLVAAKKIEQSGWSVVVNARTRNGVLTPVYCGFSPGKVQHRFPSAPSFSRQHVRVVDPELNTVHGNLVLNEPENGGFIFPLQFDNEDPRPALFSYDVAAATALPENYRLGIYDPGMKKIDYSVMERSLEVKAHGEASRWLLIGDSSFIASSIGRLAADFVLFRVFPNPCRGEMQIKFNLPFDDIRKLQIALYDQLGRRVWNRNFYGQTLRSGLNTFLLRPMASGTPGAGTYIIRISIFNSDGKRIGTRQQRILYLP